MSNEILPPKLKPELFPEEVIDEITKGIDKGVKYAKIAIIFVVVAALSTVGLISWVVIHFIMKSW